MKNLIKAGSIGAAAMPFLAFAQTTAGTILGTFGGLIGSITKILIALALAFFIYGVVKFITSKDADNKSAAKQVLVTGVIGLFLAVSVWGLVGVIQQTFGVGSGAQVGGNQLPSVNIN